MGFFLFYFKFYDLLSATIYLFIYLLNWFYETRTHICQARLESLMFLIPLPKCWNNYQFQFFPWYRWRHWNSRLGRTDHEWYSVTTGRLQLESRSSPVRLGKSCLVYWDSSFRALAGQGKCDQWWFDVILHDSRRGAQLLEVFQNVWVCIQLNFNRG